MLIQKSGGPSTPSYSELLPGVPYSKSIGLVSSRRFLPTLLWCPNPIALVSQHPLIGAMWSICRNLFRDSKASLEPSPILLAYGRRGFCRALPRHLLRPLCMQGKFRFSQLFLYEKLPCRVQLGEHLRFLVETFNCTNILRGCRTRGTLRGH